MASLLEVHLQGGGSLHYGPASRPNLLVRAKVILEGDPGATILIDGEPYEVEGVPAQVTTDPTPPPGNPDPEVTAPKPQQDRSQPRPSAPASLHDLDGFVGLESPPKPRTDKTTGGTATVGLPTAGESDARESAEISARLISEAVQLQNAILDSASERALKMSDRLAALQLDQTEKQLKRGAQIQDFVGTIIATAAEERLAAFKVTTAEQTLADAEVRQIHAHKLGLAQIEAQRDVSLAQLNRPSGMAIAVEVLMTFASLYMQGAAANFQGMNDSQGQN